MARPSLATRELGRPSDAVSSASANPGQLITILSVAAAVVGGILLLSSGHWWALVVAVLVLLVGAAVVVEDVLRYTEVTGDSASVVVPRHRRGARVVLAVVGLGLLVGGLLEVAAN